MKDFYDSPLLETRSEDAFDYILNMLIFIILMAFFGVFWAYILTLIIRVFILK